MKLIKQNDSAGGLIFKQNQNGKAMKQNYNFGLAFSPTALAEGIDVNVSDTGDWSICFWYKDENPVRETLIFVDDSSMHAIWANEPASVYTGVGMFSKKVVSRGGTTAFVVARLPSQAIGIIHIGGYGWINIGPLMFSKITDFYLYNRLISNQEIDRIYNNGLGAPPLNVSGLICHLPTRSPELLDFGEGLTPGVKNEVGSSLNGKLIKLPIGTAEEQLSYANSNLFKPW